MTEKRFVVTAHPRLNVRRAPSLSAAVIGTLPAGTLVTVTDTTNSDWYALAEGGYVAARFLVPADDLSLRYVTASALRIRSAPSLSAPILGTLSYGTPVRVQMSGDAAWARLVDRPGFVASAYLSSTLSSRLTVGVNIDPDNPVGAPTPAQVLPLRYVRFAYAAHTMDVRARLDLYTRLVSDFKGAAITPILVLNHQTFGEGRGYNWDAMQQDTAAWRAFIPHFVEALTPIVERLGARVIYQIWNEGDQASQAAVGMPALSYAALLDAAVERIRAIAPNAAIITQGHVSGDPRYWARAQSMSSLAQTLDGVAVHPYGIGGGRLGWLGTVRDTVSAWRAVTRLPLWFTEFGVCGGNAAALSDAVVADYARSFLNQAAAQGISVAIWYAYATGMDTCKGLTTGGVKGALWRVFEEWANA